LLANYSILVLLLLPIAGAVLCLVSRSRRVLTTIIGVSAAETVLAANLWTGAMRGDGVATAAGQWFYVDAFSSFHIVVLALVFVLIRASGDPQMW